MNTHINEGYNAASTESSSIFNAIPRGSSELTRQTKQYIGSAWFIRLTSFRLILLL